MLTDLTIIKAGDDINQADGYEELGTVCMIEIFMNRDNLPPGCFLLKPVIVNKVHKLLSARMAISKQL